MSTLHNVNVKDILPLTSPREIEEKMPLSATSLETVQRSRQTIRNIIDKKDKRLLAIVGPCSVHDRRAVMEYAERLLKLREDLRNQLYIIMRVYFEKPRTVFGWKGLINDPYLDGSCDMLTGLRLARRILMDITALGMPVATETLDPITPQYLSNLISWSSIGARTTESQTHREMASGLSMPVGYKNATDGNLQTAINAMQSARRGHTFLGINREGRTCIVNTRGNPWGHIIMRGGTGGPNYNPSSIKDAAALLSTAGLEPAILMDCSHANSGREHNNQQKVLQAVITQHLENNQTLIGFMLESNLTEGSVKIPDNPADLSYGISITDPCIGWEETDRLLNDAYKRLSGPQD